MSDDIKLAEKYDAQIDELKRRIAIEPTRLTEALMEQPTLMLSAREVVVDSIALRDRCKHNLELYMSSHDAQLREEAANAGERITEARLAAMVSLDEGVKGWKHSLIDANALVGKAQAVSDSYIQRSWMLRELAQIHKPFERDRFGGSAPPLPD